MRHLIDILMRFSIVILLASLIIYQLSIPVWYGISKGTLVREHHYTEKDLSIKCNWMHINPEIQTLIQPSVPQCINFGNQRQWLFYNETISCYHQVWDEWYFCNYYPIELKHSSFYFRNGDDYLAVIHIKEVMLGYDNLLSNRNLSQTSVELRRPISLTPLFTLAQINNSFEQIKRANYPFDLPQFVQLPLHDRTQDQFRKLALDWESRYCRHLRFDYWLFVLFLTIILTLIIKSCLINY